MYMLRVKEKYHKAKYRPPGILVIVNDMINYKIKLLVQLKFYVPIQIYYKNTLT
jgi:hypothetical protein